MERGGLDHFWNFECFQNSSASSREGLEAGSHMLICASFGENKQSLVKAAEL